MSVSVSKMSQSKVTAIYKYIVCQCLYTGCLRTKQQPFTNIMCVSVCIQGVSEQSNSHLQIYCVSVSVYRLSQNKATAIYKYNVCQCLYTGCLRTKHQPFTNIMCVSVCIQNVSEQSNSHLQIYCVSVSVYRVSQNKATAIYKYNVC